jgi:tyrosine-protein kinase Etk/Wzc
MQKAISDNNNPTINDLSNDDKIDLAEVLRILIDGKWLITSVIAIAIAIGIAKTFIDVPVYKSDAMLQVETFAQPVRSLEQEASALKVEIPIMAEVELINSRRVIGEAIKNLNLDIIAQPRYFPVIGESIARWFNKNNTEDKVANALFGQPQYAWGGESIKVDTFEVPTDLLDKNFMLIADEHGFFQLLYKESLLLKGKVGKLAHKQLEDKEASITIFVSQLKARPGTQFNVVHQSESNAISQLKKNLHVAEKAKLTRILELTLEAATPESAVKILNEIINVFVRRNVEQKSAEAEKTLEFIQMQLPLIKGQLDMSTDNLNDYRTVKGSVDLDLETQGLLEGVVKTKTEITLLQQKRDELRQKFTESHPSIVALDKQIARLESQVNANDHKIGTLPETQQVILKLSRDVKVYTELYTTLLNNAQTLRVAKAGTVGDVRVIDYAVLPDLPIKPQKPLIIAFSVILGLISGIAITFIRNALRRNIDNPDLIEKELHIPVYATIPHSAEQVKLSKKLKRAYEGESKNPDALVAHYILTTHNKDDLAVESLRSLRTTLHFAFLEAQNNIIMITGPSPGVGKSFVSINLAAVLADAGKKILLIDGDMRKGYLHKALGLERENGLSDLISSPISYYKNALLDLAIHKIPVVNIDFISTGSIPPNPSELLLHERFSNLLASISKNYDHVIIDSPPVLAVTDASIIGRIASATLMVVKAGHHPMQELEQTTKRLAQADVHLKGIVFNDLPEASSRYEYAHNKYAYQYASTK